VIDRRSYLRRAGGVAALAGLVGCSAGGRGSTPATPRRPSGDYRPGERVTACVRPEVIDVVDVVDAPAPVADRDRAGARPGPVSRWRTTKQPPQE
jgi:hypothetical protein